MRIRSIPLAKINVSNSPVIEHLAKFASAYLVLFALAVWLLSLQYIDLRQMNDLGLISVMPASAFLALILLTIGFCLALRQQPLRTPILLFNVLALIFMLHGITALIEEVPHFSVNWTHAGFVEYIMRTGRVAPELEARFNWPGFFILNAFITQVAGLRNAYELAGWASLVFNLLYLGPLIMILRSATRDKRLVWLGVWFFYLANWIGQDYFAPQALNYFLYLVILGIVLRWFKPPIVQPSAVPDQPLSRDLRSRLVRTIRTWMTSPDLPSVASQPGQRAGLVAVIIILFIVVVASHQLTPFAALLAVGVLVVFNRSTLRGLPILMGVMTATWISFMTVAFLSGHFYYLTEGVGQVSATVTANVANRLQGSPDHIFIVQLRLIMTLALWIAALLGGIRRLRSGHRDMIVALMAVTPFALIGLQDYGGEILLRAYLFSLPFMVFFVAALFYPTRSTATSWRMAILIGIVSIGFGVGFLFTRYGNERMDYMTQKELAGTQYLYSIAKPGSLLLGGTYNFPWKYQGYEQYYYMLVWDKGLNDNIPKLARTMGSGEYAGAYLILTRSQRAYNELFLGLPPSSWETFENQLTGSGLFNKIFDNGDAQIFVVASNEKQTQP